MKNVCGTEYLFLLLGLALHCLGIWQPRPLLTMRTDSSHRRNILDPKLYAMDLGIRETTVYTVAVNGNVMKLL